MSLNDIAAVVIIGVLVVALVAVTLMARFDR